MKPKCNLTEEERKQILPKIRSWITDEEESELLRHFPQYLFYWYENGKRETYCTACGARNRGAGGKIRHQQPVECYACGITVQAAAVNKYRYAMKSLATWGKAAFIRTDEEGNLLIMSADVLRWFNHNNLRGEIELETKAKYFLAPGKVQMWKRSVIWNGDGWTAVPVPTKTVGEGFPAGWAYGGQIVDGDYLTVGIEKLYESRFRYCAIEEYFSGHDVTLGEDRCRNVISYLAQYAMHPQLEMATKLGQFNAVGQLTEEGRLNAKYLNWNAKTPADFLRMPKQDAKLFLDAGMDLKELQMYRDHCPDGMTMAQYIAFRRDYRSETQARLLLDAAEMAGTGFRAAKKYADRFPERRKEACLREWIDYLDMAHRLGLDLREETVAMPRELHTRHDEAAAMVRYRSTAEKEEAYRKRADALRKKYEFRLGTLSVLVPETVGAIVQEGQTMHHCVGGYAERHADGKTCILFIRKTRTPERSFLTLELNEKELRIIQIHGYRNERYRNAVPPGIRYQEFLETWLLWVEQGSRRDGDGNPILPKGVKTA